VVQIILVLENVTETVPFELRPAEEEDGLLPVLVVVVGRDEQGDPAADEQDDQQDRSERPQGQPFVLMESMT
jgi:hypothetical protein